MLTCREITELVTDYAERRMGLLDRLRFQLHLGMCWACRRYVDQVRTTVSTLGRVRAEPPPPEVVEKLRARFRDWKSGRNEAV